MGVAGVWGLLLWRRICNWFGWFVWDVRMWKGRGIYFPVFVSLYFFLSFFFLHFLDSRN